MSENSHCTARHVIETLGPNLDYSTPDRSFSPFYSDMGLGFRDETGIDCLFLHYNRRTTEYGAPFLAVEGALAKEQRTVLGVTQQYEAGTVTYAFYDRNSWIVEVQGDIPSLMCHAMTNDQVTEGRSTVVDTVSIFEGSLPTLDPRDPDASFPFILGLRVMNGRWIRGDGLRQPLIFAPDENGLLRLAFSCNMLDVEAQTIEELLRQAPQDTATAQARTEAWLDKALNALPCQADDPQEVQVLAKAAFTLAFNASQAPGYLAGRVSSFPSRGGYPTHFLWDSCFQNLALEHMEPRLAEDALLLLTENLRPDGKMAHFLCSTWMRPHESQPPLVGWAGLRLVKRRQDLDLARQLLPALVKNTAWWLTQRMTRFGLIQCLDPLETGWDDSPRLDQGPTLACDMNSHLLLQMRAIAEMANMLGQPEIAAKKAEEADQYAATMRQTLYDPQDNLFKEVLVESGEKLPIKTPACFLPLLAGVPISERKARAMIEDYLLNPDLFFGPVPFPCVAYDEPTYQPDQWWRGPTWLPVAYLMLELLAKYGYANERQAAAERLYEMVWRDGEIHELFNSQTGKGMGKAQQGWTAAIFLQLKAQLG
jgi:hypothetical protein